MHFSSVKKVHITNTIVLLMLLGIMSTMAVFSAALSPVLLLLGGAGLSVWAFLVYNPMIALAVLLAGIQFYVLITDSFGVATSSNLTAVLYFGLATACTLPLLWQNRQRFSSIFLRWEVILFVWFMAWVFVNWALFSRGNQIAIQTLFGFVPTMTILPFLCGLILKTDHLEKLAWYVSILGVISLAIILSQFVTGSLTVRDLSINSRLSVDETVNPLRVAYANGLASLFLFVLAGLKSNVAYQRIKEFFAAGVIIGASFVILASSSRGPLLALVLGIVVVIAIDKSTRKVQWLAGFLLILPVVLFLFSLLPDSITARYTDFGRLFSSGGDSQLLTWLSTNRLDTWAYALDLRRDSPIWGIGLANVQSSNLGKFVHNGFLEVWVELGLLGFVLFGILFLRVTSILYRSSRNLGDTFQVKIIAALFVHSIIGMSFSGRLLAQPGFWLACGLCIGLAEIIPRSKKNSPDTPIEGVSAKDVSEKDTSTEGVSTKDTSSIPVIAS